MNTHQRTHLGAGSALALLLAVPALLPADTWYVDDDGPGNGDGLTWATAYQYLHQALAAASPGDEIKIGQGVYLPDRSLDHPLGTGDKDATFQVPSGVTLRGGYAGTIWYDPDQRDFELFPAEISGDLAQDDEPGANRIDNSFHVVTIDIGATGVVLEGLDVRGGYASSYFTDTPEGGGIRSLAADLTLRQCRVFQNYADYGGGVHGGSGALQVTNGTFSENFTTSGSTPRGGAIHSSGSVQATSTSFHANIASGDGSAVYCDGSLLNMSQCVLEQNQGRVISCDGAELLLHDVAFEGNSGGSVLAKQASAEVRDCTFTAESGSRIVDFSGALAEMTDCRVSESGGGTYWAVYTSDGEVLIQSCQFEQNSSGGIKASATAITIADCLLTGHSRGPAIDCGHAIAALIQRCHLANNESDLGGGMKLVHSDAFVEACTFLGNRADEMGGGAYVQGEALFVNCLFSGNEAPWGGGMFVDEVNGGTDAYLHNCTLIENRARLGGGGLGIERRYAGPLVTAHLYNCLLWHNADPSGRSERAQIWDSVDNVSIHDSQDFAHDPFGALPDGVVDDDGASQIVAPEREIWLEHCNVAGWTGDLDGEACFSAEPHLLRLLGFDGLAGTGDEDLSLQPGSPCIDAGAADSLPPGIDTDLRGHARVVPPQIDVGAYEFDNDCNDNGTPDDQDIAGGSSDDCDGDGLPDECERDCNGNGIADDCEPFGPVIYVDWAATGADTGESWANAYTDLAEALRAARCAEGAISEIWVAAGLYLPDQGTGDRQASFQLARHVTLYGGFLPGATNLSERDWLANPTILSGDLAQNDVGFAGREDNSYHVVNGSYVDRDSVLDGFIIEHGNAAGSFEPDAYGGGLLCEAGLLTIRNCVFQSNQAERRGAAAYLDGGSPLFESCRFEGNEFLGSGNGAGVAAYGECFFEMRQCSFSENEGALYLAGGIPRIERTVFQFNTAAGALRVVGGTVLTTDCLYVGNDAGSGGAVHVSDDGRVIIRNSTIAQNSALFCGGVYGQGSADIELVNSIVWGNLAQHDTGEAAQIKLDGGNFDIDYCCIQDFTGQFFGNGNIRWDPLFVDELGPDGLPGTDDENLHLAAGSPCIDAGDNEEVVSTMDLLGHARRVDDPLTDDTGNGDPPVVDMGAYEFGSRSLITCRGDLSGDGRVDQEDLGQLLACYGRDSGGDIDGDGDTDQSDLGILLADYECGT